MNRRTFIAALGGATAWPLVARAQQREQARRIGVLMGYPEGDPQAQANVTALRQGLENLGWIEGRNVQIDYRWAGSDPSKARAFAKELVGLVPDVIVPSTNQVTRIVQQETRTITVVFAFVGDPVDSGFVANSRTSRRPDQFDNGQASGGDVARPFCARRIAAGSRPPQRNSVTGRAVPGRVWRAPAFRKLPAAVMYLPPNTPSRSISAGESSGFPIWREAFINDADLETAQHAYDVLNPHPVKTFTDKISLKTNPGDMAVGKSYINCTEDISLPHHYPWHPRLSQKLGLFRLVQVPGSHELCFSNPGRLSQAIMDAGRD